MRTLQLLSRVNAGRGVEPSRVAASPWKVNTMRGGVLVRMICVRVWHKIGMPF